MYMLFKQIENKSVRVYDSDWDKPNLKYMKISICSFVGGMLVACLAHKMAHCPCMKSLVSKGKEYGRAMEGAVKDSFLRMKDEATKQCQEHGGCAVATDATENQS